MMQFSKMAATYFPDVEIIEKHHDNKIDAPSGTATKTVEMIQETRKAKAQGHPDEYEIVEGARGDRKSTRLNSSHVAISYAVFCLKKKKTHLNTRNDKNNGTLQIA